jgi:hypothetical protein
MEHLPFPLLSKKGMGGVTNMGFQISDFRGTWGRSPHTILRAVSSGDSPRRGGRVIKILNKEKFPLILKRWEKIMLNRRKNNTSQMPDII